jgi:hypothetical protein
MVGAMRFNASSAASALRTCRVAALCLAALAPSACARPQEPPPRPPIPRPEKKAETPAASKAGASWLPARTGRRRQVRTDRGFRGIARTHHRVLERHFRRYGRLSILL